jgi:hypothetical protein
MSTGTSTAPSVSGGRGNRAVLPLAIGGLVVFALLLVWLFRGSDELQTRYGRRMGNDYGSSVNGTYVFAEMFRQSGRNVASHDRLSPRLRKFQTIVWFPDDFGVPTGEQLDFLAGWMFEGRGRTVIYVGRDYDAATAYWTKVLPLAPPEQVDEVKRRLADAKSQFASARASIPNDRDARWFTLKNGPQQKVTAFSGDGDWNQLFDAQRAEITLASRLEPAANDGSSSERPETAEKLLTSGNDTFIARLSDGAWGDGQVLIVSNGSTLLNYPLVNKEHRKIANKLIGECSDGDVAFVESGRGGPPVEHRSLPKPHQAWPFPMNAIVFHLVMLALIYCLAQAPIFGRPRTLPADVPTDFGKHIAALGKLMQRTKDQAYAFARLQQYRQHGKRDSGKAHKK